MNGLEWQTVHLPLAAGLQQKSDDRARSAPALDLAYDVQFDELGGVQTRYPYAALGSSIFGGGTIEDSRRIVQCGGELLLFTKDTLYTWNADLSKWVSKGTHLAVKVDEEPVFVTTGDQIDCDRAELSGTIVYAWNDASVIYVAAVDKETGSVLMAPTSPSSGDTRPRLVALSTKILLFVSTGDPQLNVYAIDPAAPATAIAGAATTVVAAPDFNLYYDVVKVAGADQVVGACRRTTTTSYSVFTVTAGLTVAASTKARVCDGPIAVSSTPDGASVQVVRGNGTNVQGDLITISSLADTAHVAKAVGTVGGATINQIACAHRSVADSGQYRCYAFWHQGQSDSPLADWTSKYNYVDTGGNLGTQANFIRKAAVASRAFDHDGRVYVHIVFAGDSQSHRDFTNALQNTYFLYRDDAFLVAKIAPTRSGGFPASTGLLPSVALTDTATYSWCGTERRIVPVGSDRRGYSDRGPRDVTITFDSDEARRCVQLGQTLYIASGEILQYDGSRLVEVGFHIYPWGRSTADDAAPGSVENGIYAIKATYRDDNARGERDRSTTATVAEAELAGGTPQSIDFYTIPLYVTHRTTGRVPAIEVWRTAANPTADAPFYMVTSRDPTDTSGANCYVSNSTTTDTITFNDALADEDATQGESDPETGGVLENLAPPAASIIIAGDERIFLAGVPGDPDRVWYSKLRNDGEVAAFHDALIIPIPTEGGAITALGFLNETLIVFRETAIYALSGNGYDNLGGGNNYGPARMLSSDVGAVNHESVCFMPGGLVFKSNKGWYLLNRGWSCEYIGGAVSDYDSIGTPLAAHLAETQHQVRILVSFPVGLSRLVDGEVVAFPTSAILVWDYLVNQWAEWTFDAAVHACMWNGRHVVLVDGGPYKQAIDYTSLTYGIDIETAWFKPADLQGFARIRKLQILGEYMSTDCTHLRIRIKYNYDDSTYVDDTYWPISPTSTGMPLQVKIGPSRQQIQSIKIRITALRFVAGEDPQPDEYLAPTGEAIKLTGLALEVGLKRYPYPRLPAAQRS